MPSLVKQMPRSNFRTYRSVSIQSPVTSRERTYASFRGAIEIFGFKLYRYDVKTQNHRSLLRNRKDMAATRRLDLIKKSAAIKAAFDPNQWSTAVLFGALSYTHRSRPTHAVMKGLVPAVPRNRWASPWPSQRTDPRKTHLVLVFHDGCAQGILVFLAI
jgi:hypothetical protein